MDARRRCHLEIKTTPGKIFKKNEKQRLNGNRIEIYLDEFSDKEYNFFFLPTPILIFIK